MASKSKYCQRQRQRHAWNWLHFRKLRTWIYDNYSCLTIKNDIGQYSHFLRCFLTTLFVARDETTIAHFARIWCFSPTVTVRFSKSPEKAARCIKAQISTRDYVVHRFMMDVIAPVVCIPLYQASFNKCWSLIFCLIYYLYI